MHHSAFGGFVERLAVETYRELGLDESEPCCPIELAKTILNDPDPVEYAELPDGSNGCLFLRDGGRKIGIREGLPLHRALFATAHELAHVLFERMGFSSPAIEIACDYLGAALLAPEPAVRRIWRNNPATPASALADATACSKTWAALRFGEAIKWPVYVVKAGPEPLVRTRGGAQLTFDRSRPVLVRATLREEELPGLRTMPIRDSAEPRAAFFAA